MAQIHQVLLTCDLCDGEKPGSETANFSADGRAYEIDLCERHAKQFRDALSTFTSKGRRATSPGTRRVGRSAASNISRERSAEIRAWAKKKGLPVSERGRISADLVAKFEASAKR